MSARSILSAVLLATALASGAHAAIVSKIPLGDDPADWLRVDVTMDHVRDNMSSYIRADDLPFSYHAASLGFFIRRTTGTFRMITPAQYFGTVVDLDITDFLDDPTLEMNIGEAVYEHPNPFVATGRHVGFNGGPLTLYAAGRLPEPAAAAMALLAGLALCGLGPLRRLDFRGGVFGDAIQILDDPRRRELD